MNKYLLAIATALIGSSVALAAVVTATPGHLADAVESPATVAELTIEGSIDASDFLFIEKNMPQLRTLDISGATIAPYSGDRIRGIGNYPAATIPQGALAGSAITAVKLPAGIVVGDLAFASSKLKSVIIPAGTVSVGQGAFSACPDLETATLSPTVMGGYVFKDCQSLTTVNLGGLTSIADSDFAGCILLENISGEENLTEIGASAFRGCSALHLFDFDKRLRSIGNSAFVNCGLTVAELSPCSSLSTLGDWAFAHNVTLTGVSFPDNLSSIGRGAFFECSSLNSVKYPANCPFIADYAFKDATALTDLALPDGLTDIRQYALKGASAIQTLTLPEGVEYIGDGAMEGATGLANIDGGNLTEVPELGNDVWAGVDQSAVKLSVPDDMVSAFKSTPQWMEFDVAPVSTGVDSPEAGLQAPLRAAFSGKVLCIDSPAEIAMVALYNPAGVLLGAYRVDADKTAIDTSDTDNSLFIVHIRFADGTAAAMKLAR